MFDAKKQTKAFNSLTSTIVFWMGVENANCAASFIALAEQLPLNTLERAKLMHFTKMFDSIFPDRPYMTLKPQLSMAQIPDKYTVDDENLYAYVILTSIMNFVSAKLYNEASAVLLDMSNDWRELYVKAISSISDMEESEPFCRWCASHAIVAMDVKRTNFLDYGTFAAMYDENGFDKQNENAESDE